MISVFSDYYYYYYYYYCYCYYYYYYYYYYYSPQSNPDVLIKIDY